MQLPCCSRLSILMCRGVLYNSLYGSQEFYAAHTAPSPDMTHAIQSVVAMDRAALSTNKKWRALADAEFLNSCPLGSTSLCTFCYSPETVIR